MVLYYFIVKDIVLEDYMTGHESQVWQYVAKLMFTSTVMFSKPLLIAIEVQEMKSSYNDFTRYLLQSQR